MEVVSEWSRKCEMLCDPLQKRRMRALSSLPGWLERVEESEKTYENYYRVFKACMTLLHLTDGVYNQQSVSVQLVTLTRTNEGKRALVFGALLCAARDFWKHLDQYRVPKFLFLIRLVVSEMLFICIDESWDEKVVRDLFASLGFVMPICNLPRTLDGPNNRLMSTSKKESLLLKHLKTTQWDEDPETESPKEAQIDLKRTEYYNMNLVDTSKSKKRRKHVEESTPEWHPEWFTESRRGVAHIDGAIWHQCVSVWFDELQKQLRGPVSIYGCQPILNEAKVFKKLNHDYTDAPCSEEVSIYVHPDAVKSLDDSPEDDSPEDDSPEDSTGESEQGDDASSNDNSVDQDKSTADEPSSDSDEHEIHGSESGQDKGSMEHDKEDGGLSLQQFVTLNTPIFRALAAHTCVEATWVKVVSVFDDFLGRSSFYGSLTSFARALCVWHVFLEKLVASGLVPSTLSERANKFRISIHQKMMGLKLSQVPFDLSEESLSYIKQIACTHSLVRADELLR
ncbi:nucleolar protein,Nop52 protein [Gregarina niphandrodes]|uniref:Nucleolar protein,Nop52 protein n=1 Tax=Gregarina niphandrodes TaxID=110365 RepID=A0A023BDZ5_GRENI|nr:nucleolar protein,Nop52 protein [Gregarina niphandrodes]EZG89035.1 nucleolar protein,Nop52 protein [Gregarina niphandrodes]|eukprot:XP_011128504.1 nucleolar protein,Nop52 protein [Gregarina niphandrodes]